MVVEVIQWPSDITRREAVSSENRARLLLVERGTPPPQALDPLEDWAWADAPAVEVDARCDALAHRAQVRQSMRPEIDDHALLHFGEQWVALPPVEQRLAQQFVDRYGEVVSRDELMANAWSEPPDRNVLDVHVFRLRRRVAKVGLEIRTVRGHGYVLERAGS